MNCLSDIWGIVILINSCSILILAIALIIHILNDKVHF